MKNNKNTFYNNNNNSINLSSRHMSFNDCPLNTFENDTVINKSDYNYNDSNMM